MQSHQVVSHGVPIKCPNTRCEYKWIYKGRFVFYATCPACRHNVKISENKVESHQSHKVTRPRETEADKEFDAQQVRVKTTLSKKSLTYSQKKT